MNRSALGALALVSLASTALAGWSVNFLVPAYEPCTPPANSCPAVLESRFTFETVALKTPTRRFLKDEAVAVAVQMTGVRDESGALVTTDPADDADDFRVIVPATQTTVLGSTYVPGLLNPDIVMRVDLKNGKGKASYKTPAGGEGSGVVAEAIAIPYVVDPDGNRFAVSGSRDKPAN
jgi:hypothetical protein